jgi:hypothetical protein
MLERNRGRNAVPSALDRRKAELAGLPSPPIPDGAATVVANRVMTYARHEKTKAVLPYIDSVHGGLIISGADPSRALGTALETREGLTLLNDPAGYEKHTATVDAPFALADAGLVAVTLDDVLDRQLRAGAAAALSPTGYIPPGGTDVLREAARQFSLLGRTDAIFTAPLDVSMLDAYYTTTAAILAALGSPIALILGGQGDPLKQSSRIIPNLRDLAARVPLFPIRTDFNALDMVAHGAIAAAIGTGGSVRHTVSPADRPKAFRLRDVSPSVLWPELASWFKGSKINELFGARPSLAPWCVCAACAKQRLTRFLRPEHQDEAIGHAVATWSCWTADLLSAPTVGERALYWRNLCVGAVRHHDVILGQLKRLDGLEPQPSLQRWASLSAWPAAVPAPVS